jgi:hypothetical protein
MICFTQDPPRAPPAKCPFCYKSLMALYQKNLDGTDYDFLWYWCEHCHNKLYEQK